MQLEEQTTDPAIQRMISVANMVRASGEVKAGRAKTGPRPLALRFYGNNFKFLESTEHQQILSGPAESGKTMVCCAKLHRLCIKYPNVQAAIVRKSYADMPGTVLQTFAKVAGGAAKVYGGEKPQWYDYDNKSRVWIGGLDHPGKVLSSERDLIYVNQAEQLELDDWETLRTRATGRAGNVPTPQVIGDCNPGPPTHWIKTTIPLIESRHEDNPILFNQQTGEITAQGILSLSILDQLTGPRKARLRYGQWAGAEGMVYEDSWDAKRNLIDRFDIPRDWPRYWVIDFGFTNPFVLQWWAEDPDGRLYLYREIYHTQILVEDHARRATELSKDEPKPQAVICDHDAEGRATFERHAGVGTVAAKKDVLEGIQLVAARLRKAGDSKPRAFILKGSLVGRDKSLADKHKPTCTAEEIEGYIWKEPSGKQQIRKKEEPLKENDHGCLVAGTLVETVTGSVPIEHIRPLDRVLTRNGYRTVLASGLTNPNASLVCLRLQNDKTLTATPNHPIWVKGKGWIRMDALRYNDAVWVSGTGTERQNLRQHITRGEQCVSGAETRAIRAMGTTAVGAFGSVRSSSKVSLRSSGIWANVQMATLWTVLMKRADIRRRIAGGLRPVNKFDQVRHERNTSVISRSKRENGTQVQKGENGIVNTRSGRRSIGLAVRCPASSADNPFKLKRLGGRDFVQTNVGQRPAVMPVSTTKRDNALTVSDSLMSIDISRKNPALDYVLSVSVLNERKPVFNLTVDNDPEFFANGILVHNCDGMRYMVAHRDFANGWSEFW